MKYLIIILTVFTISCATNPRKNSSCTETITHEMVRNGDTIKTIQVNIFKHGSKTNM